MPVNDVYVPGLGNVPMTFRAELKDITIDATKDWNYHNEARASLKCEPKTDFFHIDDNISVNGTYMPNGGGYKLRMSFDTWSHVELYRRGEVELTYNPEFSSWTMRASKDKGGVNEWYFCSPDEALNLIKSALTCYATTDDAQDVGTAGMALLFARSIEDVKADTASRAHLYSGDGCTVDMEKAFEEARFEMCSKYPCD